MNGNDKGMIKEQADTGIADLRGLVNIIWNRRYAFILILSLIMIAGTLSIFRLTPFYRAEAFILLISGGSADLAENSASRVQGPTDPFVIRNEVSVMTSDEICRRAINNLRLYDNAEFNSPDESMIDSALQYVRLAINLMMKQSQDNDIVDDEDRWRFLLAAYKSRLVVLNDGRSAVATVSFAATDRNLAAEVANEHAKVYLSHQVERRLESKRVAATWLSSEFDKRAEELKQSEVAVQNYRANYGMISSAQDARTTVDQEVATFNEKLIEVKAELAAVTVRLEDVRTAIKAGLTDFSNDLSNSPLLIELRQKEANTQTNLLRLGQQSNGNEQATEALRAELGSIQETIQKEIERTERRLAADERTTRAKVQLIEKEVDRAERKKRNFDEASIQLRALEAVAASKRSIYDVVLTRYDRAIAEQGFDFADAKLISAAWPPTEAYFPKKALLLVVLTVVASVLSAILLVVLDAIMKFRSRNRNAF